MPVRASEAEQLRFRDVEREDRPPMNQDEFDHEFGNSIDGFDAAKKFKRKLENDLCGPFRSCSSFKSSILSFFPIVQWLPQYDFRADFISDVMGGLTTGIMHVPQGIAYSVLAGVEPVYGLYASCFPAFFYMLFGTSRHTSLGSFAVFALMAGIANGRIMENLSGGNGAEITTSIEIATTLTLAIGLWQALCGVLRLQFLLAYFSSPLVSGFTTGAAVHVLLAQIDDLLGVEVKKVSGVGYVFVRLYDLAVKIPVANLYSIGISFCSVAFLLIGKELISPFLVKKFSIRIPIPYELFLVAITAALSSVFSWSQAWNVMVVGEIPAGIRSPAIPKLSILPDCMMQAAGIAIVGIAVHISMAKMLANKMKYKIQPNQELYALGLASVCGSLFPVYPVATALGRTMVSVRSGTRTQLSTVFSCALLLAVMLWLGPFLQELPKCVLASIITVALKSMFEKFSEPLKLYPISKADFLTWIVAFLATTCIDVMEGLAISLLFAVMTVIIRTQWPRWHYYIPAQPQTKSPVFSSIGLFRFDGPLQFTNFERFCNGVRFTLEEWEFNNKMEPGRPRYFILDFSSVCYVDYMGTVALKEICTNCVSKDLTIFIAGANEAVREVISAAGLYSTISKEQFFPSVKDAISIARRNSEAYELLRNAQDEVIRNSPTPTTPSQDVVPVVRLSSVHSEISP